MEIELLILQCVNNLSSHSLVSFFMWPCDCVLFDVVYWLFAPVLLRGTIPFISLTFWVILAYSGSGLLRESVSLFANCFSAYLYALICQRWVCLRFDSHRFCCRSVGWSVACVYDQRSRHFAVAVQVVRQNAAFWGNWSHRSSLFVLQKETKDTFFIYE